MIFSEEEENQLSDYLITASKHHHGLTTIGTHKLALDFAKKNKQK
jgi:hypothetical protein